MWACGDGRTELAQYRIEVSKICGSPYLLVRVPGREQQANHGEAGFGLRTERLGRLGEWLRECTLRRLFYLFSFWIRCSFSQFWQLGSHLGLLKSGFLFTWSNPSWVPRASGRCFTQRFPHCRQSLTLPHIPQRASEPEGTILQRLSVAFLPHPWNNKQLEGQKWIFSSLPQPSYAHIYTHKLSPKWAQILPLTIGLIMLFTFTTCYSWFPVQFRFTQIV